MNQSPSTRWGVVFLILFAASVSAAQLGKLPGALPEIRADLQISLVTAGWIISTFVLIGAFCGGHLPNRTQECHIIIHG